MVTLTRRAGFIVACVGVMLAPCPGLGQVPATQPARANEPVVLDFPADGVELKVLADIVTKRLGIPIIYDEAIDGKRVIIRVPQKVPESALLGILQSALRMKQMVLVDAEQPGWKQIVGAQNLAAIAKPAIPGQTPPPGAAVTQVLTLRHADQARVVEAIRPLLTQPGGNVVPVQGQRMIIISDYPSVIARAEQLARLLDSDGPPVETRFVPLKEAEASSVASTVAQLLSTRDKALWGEAVGLGVFVTPDDRLNQVVVVAPADRMKEVVDLITGMDRPQELVTKVYRMKSISPERIDRLMKNLLGATAKRAYQATIDRESQSLVVSGTPGVQARVVELVKELDQPVTGEASPIQFYKLKNSKAVDVLATIEALTGENGLESPGPPAVETDQMEPAGPLPAQSNNPANPPATLSDRVAMAAANQSAVAPPVPGQPIPQQDSPFRSLEPANALGRADRMYAAVPYAGAVQDAVLGIASVRAANATVTADVNTNSIIVIAPPAAQQLYADLIARLDIRRPQVQIECTIVAMDTSDGFSLGVDIGVSGSIGSSSVISFSSFGVAVVDPATGALTPTRGRGGTFALLNPSVADIVIRALSTNTRSRLVSAPQLLVNDNGKGQLKSVDQQPYAEIVDSNASQAITSFGGQIEAGTTIIVEPHISQDDYLQLSYSVELSNFTSSSGQSGLPPPSQANSVNSTVTIPDGYTIVVGGLSTKNFRATVESIPLLGQIPLLKYLIGTRSQTTTDRTLFVFIRPVILRDDKFADLKYLSERATSAASLKSDYPVSEPIPLR